MFSRFDTIPACDRRTEGRTDRRTDVQPIAITCFSMADARRNNRLTHLGEMPGVGGGFARVGGFSPT